MADQVPTLMQLHLLAHMIPFFTERNFLRRVHLTPDTRPVLIEDRWDTLAILLERHGDRTRRLIMMPGYAANPHPGCVVRVRVSGRERGSTAFDYPVLQTVAEELIRSGLVGRLPNGNGGINMDLKLTEWGAKALVGHIQQTHGSIPV